MRSRRGGTGSPLASRVQQLLPPSMRGPSRRASWQRAKLRRLLCALLVGVAAWCAVSASLPTHRPIGEPVVVAARDLAAGQRLSAPDLRLSRWPADLRPQAAFSDLDLAVGRTLTGPMSPGEAVSVSRVRGADLLAGLPADLVLAHIMLSDPALAAMLRAGDRVDATATADGTILGSDLLVLAGAPAAAATDEGHLGGMPATVGGTSEALAADGTAAAPGVLVATSPAVASRLAATQGSDAPGAGVVLTLRRPR